MRLLLFFYFWLGASALKHREPLNIPRFVRIGAEIARLMKHQRKTNSNKILCSSCFSTRITAREKYGKKFFYEMCSTSTVARQLVTKCFDKYTRKIIAEHCRCGRHNFQPRLFSRNLLRPWKNFWNKTTAEKEANDREMRVVRYADHSLFFSRLSGLLASINGNCGDQVARETLRSGVTFEVH